MNEALVCWKCGTAWQGSGRFARLEACRHCGAELHVCVMCGLYDPHTAERCREERAEPPRDRTQANFCDYFVARPGAYTGEQPTDTGARSALDALFGTGTVLAKAADDEARSALDALFKKDR